MQEFFPSSFEFSNLRLNPQSELRGKWLIAYARKVLCEKMRWGGQPSNLQANTTGSAVLKAFSNVTSACLVCLMCLCIPSLIQAQVIISEVHPAPSSGSDWVEVINTSSSSISLSGWSIEDSSSAMSSLPSLSSIYLNSSDIVVLEVSNRLNNSSDSVILRNSAGVVVDQMSYTTVTPDLSWSRSLNYLDGFVSAAPTRGAVNFLSTSPTPVASTAPSPLPSPSTSPLPSSSPNNSSTPSPTPTSTSSPLPTASASPSVNPTPSSSPSASSSPATTSTPAPSASPSTTPTLSPTPTSSSSSTPSPSASPTPLSYTYSSFLFLSEIMSCPSSDSEWAEIYNSSDLTLTLSGWKVRDEGGSSRSFDLQISPRSWGVAYWASGLLNNDGDKLSLERPDGVVIQKAQFGECSSKGSSFVLVNGSWLESSTPTPGSSSLVTIVAATSSPSPSPSPSPTPAGSPSLPSAYVTFPSITPSPWSYSSPNFSNNSSLLSSNISPFEESSFSKSQSLNPSSSSKISEDYFFPFLSGSDKLAYLSLVGSRVGHAGGIVLGESRMIATDTDSNSDSASSSGASSGSVPGLDSFDSKSLRDAPVESAHPLQLLLIFICGVLILATGLGGLIHQWYTRESVSSPQEFYLVISAPYTLGWSYFRPFLTKCLTIFRNLTLRLHF